MPGAEDLISQISNRNEEAFRLFYNLFQARVFNTCLSYLKNNEEAEEATQDIFLEIHKSAILFRQESSASTWVYRLTVNKCLDRIRHRGRQKRFAIITALFNKETGALNIDPPEFNHPGILLENKEQATILFKAIGQLPENQQTAFILKHVEKLPQKEIALIMKVGEKAVESLLQRAKTNLRRLLSGFYDDTEGKAKK